MHISSFIIHNYKSFSNSGEISLSAGFNVAVGQNNVGKSTMIEALSCRFINSPHKSIETLPTPISTIRDVTSVKITFFLSFDELQYVFSTQLDSFYLPVDVNNRDADPRLQSENHFNNAIRNGLYLECVIRPDGEIFAAQIKGFTIRSDKAAIFNYNKEKNVHELNFDGGISVIREADQLPVRLAVILRDRIYSFEAERYNTATSHTGPGRILRSNASNLPEVIQNLSSNTVKFAKFNKYVSTIFPQIKQITVSTISQEDVRINVWCIDPNSEREDLANSLDDSGTGVGQVLAMLYVVMTALTPQVIIIDEPQSFLHPGAIRKLIDILRMYPQHQYILTTHSPTVVTAAEPSTLLMLTKSGNNCEIETLDADSAQDLSKYLLEIGARLSDVFGADNILWVEGGTEETCFPLILKSKGIPLFGTNILGVKQTGDFEGKHAEKILDIYSRLSGGNALLPRALAFIFDREGKSDKEIEDLKRSGSNVMFLSRRMYENYLLDVDGITALIATLDNFNAQPISSSMISSWMFHNKWNKRYIDITDQQEEIWIEKVDGAKLLEDLFKQLSEARYEYDKIPYGEFLTNWLLENKPQQLEEVSELLKSLLLENIL